MKTARIINGLLQLLIIAPIWYYLVYKILEAVNASELMWFLFWIYVPAGIITKIIVAIVDSAEEHEKIVQFEQKVSGFKERLGMDDNRILFRPHPQKHKDNLVSG